MRRVAARLIAACLIPACLIPASLIPGVGAIAGAQTPPPAVREPTPMAALDISDLTPARVAAKLGKEAFRIDADGDVLTLLARSAAETFHVGGSVRLDLQRIGPGDEKRGGLWAGRVKLRRADHAMLVLEIPLAHPDAESGTASLIWRGPQAPARPPEVASDTGRLRGRVVEHHLSSKALGETRKVFVYTPPHWSKTQSLPALYMTDAGALTFAPMIEAMIAQHEIRPILIIGADNGDYGVIGRGPPEGASMRGPEYLPTGARFADHMRFFVDEMTPWAAKEFNASTRPEDRAVSGASNGGAFALRAGLDHGDVFGTAIAMSPAGAPPAPEAFAQQPNARFFLSGGDYEAGIQRNARSEEAMLFNGGFDVQARYYAAGHNALQWKQALHDALVHVFPVTKR